MLGVKAGFLLESLLVLAPCKRNHCAFLLKIRYLVGLSHYTRDLSLLSLVFFFFFPSSGVYILLGLLGQGVLEESLVMEGAGFFWSVCLPHCI